MPRVQPFHGTLYDTSKVDLNLVTAPPYDVISPAEQAELYQRHPANVVRLILGYQHDTDTETDNRYTRSAADLKAMHQDGTLQVSPAPAFYLYQQEFTHKGRTYQRNGLMAQVEIQEYEQRGILPHERTLPGAKTDRLHLLRACEANFSPVFCVYTDPEGQVDSTLLANLGTFHGEVTEANGVISRLWSVDDPAAVAAISERLGGMTLYIADGHHRYETSLRYRNERREADPAAAGERPWDYVMMMLVNTESPGMLVLPTHRLVRDVPSERVTRLLSSAAENFSVEQFTAERKEEFFTALRASADAHGIGVYLPASSPEAGFHLLTPTGDWKSAMPAERTDAWKELDVAILHHLLLNQLLDVSLDPGEAKSNLTFEVDEEAVVAAVDSSEHQLAFFLNHTPPSAVQRIAEIGEIMPQKSTYFFPKPLSGMVIRELGPQQK